MSSNTRSNSRKRPINVPSRFVEEKENSDKKKGRCRDDLVNLKSDKNSNPNRKSSLKPIKTKEKLKTGKKRKKTLDSAESEGECDSDGELVRIWPKHDDENRFKEYEKLLMEWEDLFDRVMKMKRAQIDELLHNHH